MQLWFLHFRGGLVFDSVKIHIYVDIPLLVDSKVVVCSWLPPGVFVYVHLGEHVYTRE